MIKIRVDITEFANAIQPLRTAPQWIPVVIKGAMPQLCNAIVKAMRHEVSPHRYTDQLEESINWTYDGRKMELSIGPDAKRGSHDAGMILQLGTRPIKNVPWKPIAAWANFRGIAPRAVVAKIMAEGVTAHPFLTETLNRADVGRALEDAAKQTGDNISVRVFAGKAMLGGMTVS